ncbi:hypothetical protein ABZ078_35685 [Streptomyces sp. NPDC006385]|uniref:hypothetical protein n=1 Tax=Streptomyces sp. NPDC006385 TaxID=3156761 RepID=UPI0033BE995C
MLAGGQPGRPISTTQLTRRLNQLGIRPNQARSTALFQLATEIPAAILARTLGTHTDVAVAWQRLSSGYWAAEAARRLEEFGQRTRFQGTVALDDRRPRRIMSRDDPAIYPGTYITCVHDPSKALCERAPKERSKDSATTPSASQWPAATSPSPGRTRTPGEKRSNWSISS